jgi:hypothetical protein
VFLWPLLDYSHLLSDRESDPRPVLNCGGEQRARFSQIIASVEQPIYFRAILGPFLDFAKVAIVREERIISFLFAPIRLIRPPRHVRPHSLR